MSALEQNISDSDDSDDENGPFAPRGRGLFGKFSEQKRRIGAIELSETRRHSRDSTRWFQPEVDYWRQQRMGGKRIFFIVEMKPSDAFFDGTIIQRLCPQVFCIAVVFPMGRRNLIDREYYQAVLFEDDNCGDRIIRLDDVDDVVGTWLCHLSWIGRLTPKASIAIPLRLSWIKVLVNCVEINFGIENLDIERKDPIANLLFDGSAIRDRGWRYVNAFASFTTEENHIVILEGPAKNQVEAIQLITTTLANRGYECVSDIKIARIDYTFNNDFLRLPSYVAVPAPDRHRRWPALLQRTIDLAMIFGPSLKETLPPYVFEQVILYEPHFLLHMHGKRIQAIIQIYESIRVVLASRRIAK